MNHFASSLASLVHGRPGWEISSSGGDGDSSSRSTMPPLLACPSPYCFSWLPAGQETQGDREQVARLLILPWMHVKPTARPIVVALPLCHSDD